MKIKVLDLSGLIEYLREQYKTDADLVPNVRVGICRNDKGLVVLDNEGNGIPGVVDQGEFKVEIMWVKEGELIKVTAVSMNIKGLEDIEVEEEIELEEFIGDNVYNRELRCQMWKSLIGVVKDEPVPLNRQELKKYGKYLIKEICECNKSKVITAGNASCQCGIKKEHTHCLSCGGIKTM